MITPQKTPKSHIGMNTHQLRDMRKKEIADLWKKMDQSEGDMDIFHEIQKVADKYGVLIIENDIVQNWGFPAEEWATFSQETKKIIVDMDAEANRYEQLREDLQGWLEEAP